MKCELKHTTIHYEIHGNGKPVLLLHGFSCDHHLMTGCMEPVFKSQSGWKRIYPDLPGMGDSTVTDGIQSTDDMLEALDEFVGEILGDVPFILAGESYGGYLSRGLLKKRQHQIEGLLLICPTAGQAKHDAPAFQLIARDEEFMSQLNHPYAGEFNGMHTVQDEYNWSRFEQEIVTGLKKADRPFLERLRQRYDFSPEMEQLDTPYVKPVLILAGRQDHIVGYRNQWAFANEYPRASFVMLDRAGHNLQIEQSRLFHVLVEEWLDRVTEEQEAKHRRA